MTGHVDPVREAMAAFRDLPTDLPVAMINLVRFKALADYPADHCGQGSGLGSGLTGTQAYAAYSQAAAAPFARAGGLQVWLGRPELVMIGPADERWDIAFIAQYPSASAFLSMLHDPEYQAAVIHRQAAVADSRLIRCTPADPGHGFGQSVSA